MNRRVPLELLVRSDCGLTPLVHRPRTSAPKPSLSTQRVRLDTDSLRRVQTPPGLDYHPRPSQLNGRIEICKRKDQVGVVFDPSFTGILSIDSRGLSRGYFTPPLSLILPYRYGRGVGTGRSWERGYLLRRTREKGVGYRTPLEVRVGESRGVKRTDVLSMRLRVTL